MNTAYSIIGLGKLGASMAAAIASRGFNVIGVDINQRAVDLMNAGHAPVQETMLEETIAANRERLRATLSHHEAILNSDVSFVIVPTPTDERGAFSLQYAKWAFQEIGRALAKKERYHLVVMTSTVLPGSTRYGLLPVLEKESGKVCGHDFGLCYSPEFIALGSVIYDFLNPDFNLIGEHDERAGSQLQTCYAEIMENHAPCQRMSLENAELTKVALNTFVTTKITYANMLAELCSRLPGGDVDVVSAALGLDTRIGRKYLTGGLGYGGPCFPRDNIALSWFARIVGCEASLAETTDRLNRTSSAKLTQLLCSIIKPPATVAILGLAYKPYSHVVEESQGIYLARELAASGLRVVSYDPLAKEMARQELTDKAMILEDLNVCLQQADAVVIATPDPEFRALQAADFPRKNQPVVVFDCWRILREKLISAPHLSYIALGIGTDDATSGVRLKELWSNDVK
ncbi:MAG: nucleotide sugar dehydrogenase [Chloroflexi bacterium]|nr:nucleotide sugar dehydrogenase [Chloroflexota bacterium]